MSANDETVVCLRCPDLCDSVPTFVQPTEVLIGSVFNHEQAVVWGKSNNFMNFSVTDSGPNWLTLLTFKASVLSSVSKLKPWIGLIVNKEQVVAWGRLNGSVRVPNLFKK